MKNRIILGLITLGIMQGCTGQPQKEESAFIILKTPNMKYADMGFIKDNVSNLQVEMYTAGQPLVSIEVNGVNVCMSTFKCMEKKDFNEKIFSKYYPNELLENVLRGKAIFNGENLEKSVDGFTQKIQKKDLYDITYRVVSGERKFRDTINKILIKVRKQ